MELLKRLLAVTSSRLVGHRATNDSWLRAQTLSERLEALRKLGGIEHHFIREEAEARLASWKSLSGFRQDDERFARRLQVEGCSEAEFLKVLGTDPEHLYPSGWVPRWQQEILGVEAAEQKPIKSKVLAEFTDRGIVAPFLPLIRAYSLRLALLAEDIGLPCQIDDQAGPVDAFLTPFLQNFELRVRRAVVLEVNCQRMLGNLSGRSPSERFLNFVTKFERSEHRLLFLRKYPVLALIRDS